MSDAGLPVPPRVLAARRVSRPAGAAAGHHS